MLHMQFLKRLQNQVAQIELLGDNLTISLLLYHLKLDPVCIKLGIMNLSW